MSRAPSIDTAPSGSNRDLSNRASMQFAPSGLQPSTSRSSQHDESGQVCRYTFHHLSMCQPPGSKGSLRIPQSFSLYNTVWRCVLFSVLAPLVNVPARWVRKHSVFRQMASGQACLWHIYSPCQYQDIVTYTE